MAGTDRVDAGKTTFATGLLARVGGLGVKPRAGNDYWFEHDDVRAALAGSRLHGEDPARLIEASAGEDDVEAINPLHRLWRRSPLGGPFIGAADRRSVLARAGDGWIVNADADVPSPGAEALPPGDAQRVSTVDEVDAAREDLAVPALEALAGRVGAIGTAVIESYSDIARPLDDLGVDRVAVVEPGRARVFDGERYGAACEVAGQSPRGGRLEERVGDVVELLEPEDDVDLPALVAEERADPGHVVGAYARAYDVPMAGGD